jgi:hypothetical protein
VRYVSLNPWLPLIVSFSETILRSDKHSGLSAVGDIEYYHDNGNDNQKMNKSTHRI